MAAAEAAEAAAAFRENDLVRYLPQNAGKLEAVVTGVVPVPGGTKATVNIRDGPISIDRLRKRPIEADEPAKQSKFLAVAGGAESTAGKGSASGGGAEAPVADTPLTPEKVAQIETNTRAAAAKKRQMTQADGRRRRKGPPLLAKRLTATIPSLAHRCE